MARTATKRKKILSFLRAYHGSTYGAISLSAVSLPMRRGLGPLLPEIHHIPYPDTYRTPFAGMSEEDVTAYSIERIKNSSQHAYRQKKLQQYLSLSGRRWTYSSPQVTLKLYENSDTYGILLISEEVQQGFGRTGKWFGMKTSTLCKSIVMVSHSFRHPLGGVVQSRINGTVEALPISSPPQEILHVRCCLCTIDVIKEENLEKTPQK